MTFNFEVDLANLPTLLVYVHEFHASALDYSVFIDGGQPLQKEIADYIADDIIEEIDREAIRITTEREIEKLGY